MSSVFADIPLKAVLTPEGRLSASLSQAPMIINDWVIAVQEIEGGKRLIARRGSEEQVMDVMDGQPGNPGKDGKYYIPKLDANGFLSFTSSEPNEYGEMEVIGFTTSLKGAPGTPGKAGKTPVKGVDYFTPADKAELVEDVTQQLPQKAFTVTDDGNGNIALNFA